MKIIVDAFGGDNAPLEIIKGCAEAVAEFQLFSQATRVKFLRLQMTIIYLLTE